MMQRFLPILLLLTSVISYGQVTVFTEVNTRDARLNEPLVLTVVQEIVGENMDQQTPLQLMDLSKFDILGNASERNTFVDPRRGIRIHQLIYQVYLQPKVAGKVKIGSALVTVNGKIYKSEPLEVTVKDVDRRAETLDYLSKEVFLNLEVEDRMVYENQPVVAILKAYSKNFDNFRKLENIRISPQNEARIKPISYKKRDIESEDGEFASQEVGRFLIIPQKSGSIEIEPVSALLKTPEVSRVASNKIRLNVKTLPAGAPAHFKDAVGEFKVEFSGPAAAKVEVGKPVEVVVKVSGSGNLDAEKLPKILPTEAYQVYQPQLAAQLTTNETGVSGEVTAKYVLVPKRDGALNISTEPFAFFSPAQNSYVDLGAQSLVLQVLNAQQLAAQKTTMDMVNDYTQVVMETVKIPTEKNRGSAHFTFNMRYILLNLGLISGGVLLLFLLYKYRTRSKNVPVLAPVTTVADEEQKIRQQLKPDFTAYFEYLKVLCEGGNHSEFFKTYAELHEDAERWVEQCYNVPLETYVDGYLGESFAEEYAALTREIAMEKYAPLHDAAMLDAFFARVVPVYTEITREE